MLKALITVSAVLIATAMPLAAAVVEGHLVDQMCSAKVLKGGADAAKAHTKDCALMPNCQGSGYGVVTEDGKFIKFDEYGNGMAVSFLESTRDDDDIKVVVNGKIDGDTIEVVAIQLDMN